MKRSLSLWFTALAIAAAASVGMVAHPAQDPPQNPPRGRGVGPGGPGPWGMLQRLNLTNEQKTQIRTILDERQKTADPAGMSLQKQLHEAIFADTPDTAKIGELKTAIKAAQAANLDERVAQQLRIAQILTPEQRQEAREFQGRMGPGPFGRGGRGRP